MARSWQEQLQFRAMVAGLNDLKSTFELVKKVVRQEFGMHRAGLSLALQVMPRNLGAYHVLGSNAIIVNSYVLAVIKEITHGGEEYISYVFMILAHEYFHSLGIVDEHRVRQMTYELCKSLLGEDHWSTRMAKEDPASLYPQLRSLAQSGFGTDFNVIRDFDTGGHSYIQ